MSKTSKSSLAQNQIPQIRELQDKLGFDGTDGRSPADLRDVTHHFRKEYLTSDGTPGRDLKDWKHSRTQTELLRMARTFLEDEHYGMKFWSASANSSSKRGLEYPKDSDRLAELLQQLFWRQNKYSAHNANNPDRNRHVQESVESDSSSATVQPNRSYLVERRGFVPLSEQDLQRLPLRVATDDTRSAGVSKGAPIERPPNSRTHPEESDDSDLPEDIFAYHDSRRSLVRRRSGPDENSLEPNANQDEGNEITKIVDPKPRGVAPEAKMLPPQEAGMVAARQNPITPDHKGIAEKSSTSREKPITESKRGKRKDVEDDDSEYTPSKKMRWEEGISNIASSKPRRRRAGNTDDNHVEPQSGSAADQFTSPSTTIGRSNTGTDRIFSSQPAGFSELGQPSTPESRNISVENSPSMPRRTPLLDKLREKKKREEVRLESINETIRGHHQTKLNFSPTSRAVATRPQNGGSPSMSPYDARPRDVADETLPPPEPALNTATQAAENEVHDALTIAANILDQDSVRSQTSRGTGLATPEPAQDDPQPQITDIAIDIRYSIIASRVPRLIKRNWPIQSLIGKTVRNLFEEVSKFTSKPEIQRIVFTLNLSQADSEYTIGKDDHRTFEAMKDDFADDIMADWRENGITKFSIWLEPDPTEEGNQMNPGTSGVLNVDEGRPRITI